MAEREGHAVIDLAADIKSGTVAPWNRKNLKQWMTDPAMMAMYDGLLVYRTDRLSRGTQSDYTYIEHWAVSHGKRIIVADGPQFPKRDDSDYWRWNAEKDAARKEWEAIRARQMSTQSALKAAGHAVGRAPFGYRIAGETYSKRFEIDPWPARWPVRRSSGSSGRDGHHSGDLADPADREELEDREGHRDMALNSEPIIVRIIQNSHIVGLNHFEAAYRAQCPDGLGDDL